MSDGDFTCTSAISGLAMNTVAAGALSRSSVPLPASSVICVPFGGTWLMLIGGLPLGATAVGGGAMGGVVPGTAEADGGDAEGAGVCAALSEANWTSEVAATSPVSQRYITPPKCLFLYGIRRCALAAAEDRHAVRLGTAAFRLDAGRGQQRADIAVQSVGFRAGGIGCVDR